MTRLNAGAAVARMVARAGVDRAFTVPGESFLGLLDALPDAGIDVVAARHEGAAAFMASAHATMTQRPGALLVTRAVGAANAAIGIHTAYSDSVPVVVFVGQVPSRHRGREAFQEVDVVATFGALAKWAAEPTSPEELLAATRMALNVALDGRPGPVLVAVREDLLDLEVEADGAVSAPAAMPVAAPRDVVRTLEILRGADRPAILAGHGVLRSGAVRELQEVAEALEIPVIAGWRRPEVFDNEHGLYLGMTGYWSPQSVRDRLASADVLLAIGTRLGEPASFVYTVPSADARWIHVDLNPRRPQDPHPPELAIRSDAGAFLRALQSAVGPLDRAAAGKRNATNQADRAVWEQASVVDNTHWDGPGVHPGRVVKTMMRVLPADTIITTDAGNFAGWVARGYRFRPEGKLVGPTSGAMGYALPAAVAGALAYPGRTIVGVAGDGGLGMTIMDLETAVRAGARPVILCFDNQRYGTIRMWQERRRSGIGIATELGAVDFAAIAGAVGGIGLRVATDDALEPALRTALAADRPSLIQLRLDPRWVSVDQVPDSGVLE